MSTIDHGPKAPRANLYTPAAGTPPRDTYAIQRRGTRVPMQDPAPVQLHLRAADLLDISLSGALVEHIVGVRVGEVYRLFFPVQGVEVEVLARAVRSFVSRVVPVAGGEGQIVYRTGLEFVELKESMAKTLTAYIDDLHRQTATRRPAQPAAQVLDERTKVSNREDSNTGVAARPRGRVNAVPASQLTRTIAERRAWSRWSLAGVLMLGSAVVSSLLYVAGTPTYTGWSLPRALLTVAPMPAAPTTEAGGESLSALLSRARGSVESEVATLGLLTVPQAPMLPAPTEYVAAQVLGSFSQPTQAGVSPDLWPPLSDLNSILGLRVSLPQWPPAWDKGVNQPGVTESTVSPTQSQSPAEPPVSEEGKVAPDPPPSEWPVASHTSTHITALPPPALTRPEESSVPTLRERTPPSGRVHPKPESPSPRQDKAPRKVTSFRGVDLRGADLRGANLQGADLTGARLAWARLTGAKLQGATLQAADLTEADLWMADLRGANLQGADLTGARLAWARLVDGRLQGATLQAADLTEADLWMADLRGANLQGADLRGAKLTPPDQAAKEAEAAAEAIAVMPTPGEARPGTPVEILDPRRTLAERPREDEPR